jgi:reductive dehalogenase
MIGGGFFFLATRFSSPAKAIVLLAVGISLIVFLILFLLPIGKVEVGKDTPSIRFDERDIMFARKRLIPGSPEYQAYYQMRPENQQPDDQTRSKPGLLSLKAKFANPFNFASAQGSFHLTGALREAVDGPVSDTQKNLPMDEMTAYIKGLALYFGALDVGVTKLKPYHVYSHIGRGPGKWGDPISVEHDYAIAFTVEMSYEMVGANPTAIGVMESAKQYVEASRVAVSLAAAIRYLGYPARAHIDGSYRVICPLVARDAGLGEIGRMSLLMTPRQGPRVRLGVVTTNLTLIPDRRRPDAAVIDFCNVCKKCAENCPSNSIPFDDRQEVNGALQWRLDADTCFRYWNVVGTDCGICMKTCPYAHPNTFFHNLIRWGTERSGFFRRASLWLDDLFYGKKPAQRKSPRWARVSE